ncbi:MAG: stage II sporulation protein M [Bacillota bacterium]
MKRFLNYFFREKLLLIIFVLIIFLSGICFGAYGIKNIDYGLKKDLYTYFEKFIVDFKVYDMENNLLIWNGFKDNLLSFMIIVLSSLFVFTFPIILFMIFLKAFVLAFSISFFLVEYGTKGLLLSTFLIFPQNIFLVTAYLFSAVISLDLSLNIINYYRGAKRLLNSDKMFYFYSYLFSLILIIIAILIESYLTPYLLNIIKEFILN